MFQISAITLLSVLFHPIEPEAFLIANKEGNELVEHWLGISTDNRCGTFFEKIAIERLIVG